MYDRWFSQQELQVLPFAEQDAQRNQIWLELVGEAQQLMGERCPADEPRAIALATRWMAQLEQDTAGRPEFLTRLNEMHAAEPQMREQTGVTPEMIDFITRAFAESKLAIWARYLNAEELAFTRQHYFDRLMEWPALVAELHRACREAGACLRGGSAAGAALAGAVPVLRGKGSAHAAEVSLCHGAGAAFNEGNVDDAGGAWLASAGDWRNDAAGAGACRRVIKYPPARRCGPGRSSGGPESA